jgi:hypothetical protein
MGELLLDECREEIGAPWSVERRFRVTEVFLAVLWVCIPWTCQVGRLRRSRRKNTEDKEGMLTSEKCLCSGYLSFYFTDCLMSRW